MTSLECAVSSPAWTLIHVDTPGSLPLPLALAHLTLKRQEWPRPRQVQDARTPRAGGAEGNEEPQRPAWHPIATELRIDLGLLPSTPQSMSPSFRAYAARQSPREPHLHPKGSRHVSLSSLTFLLNVEAIWGCFLEEGGKREQSKQTSSWTRCRSPKPARAAVSPAVSQPRIASTASRPSGPDSLCPPTPSVVDARRACSRNRSPPLPVWHRHCRRLTGLGTRGLGSCPSSATS